MITRVFVHSLSLLVLVVRLSKPVCVNVDAETYTQAVMGDRKKLQCISCLKREELSPKTRVDWFYVPPAMEPIAIFLYEGGPRALEGRWFGRVSWEGSRDLQDLSITLSNVTLNDSGTYRCNVSRTFDFQTYKPHASDHKKIHLTVTEEEVRDPTALYSEIMMYVLLVFLTCWLLLEMVYCYRKISRADDQPPDTATNYLAIPSEHKDSLVAPATRVTVTHARY